MSNHVVIRLIRFVSRFTVHLCNAIYFSTIFSTPCKLFIKILRFAFWHLNTALLAQPFVSYLFCKRIVAVFLQMQSQKEKKGKAFPRLAFGTNHLAVDLYNLYNSCIQEPYLMHAYSYF